MQVYKRKCQSGILVLPGVVIYNKAALAISFRSGDSDNGNSMSNSIIKSPFFSVSFVYGIPSRGTIFL